MANAYPLPTWTVQDLEAELLRLTRGQGQVMVSHLCQGLREDLSNLSPRECLYELLCLLAAVLPEISRPEIVSRDWQDSGVRHMP